MGSKRLKIATDPLAPVAFANVSNRQRTSLVTKWQIRPAANTPMFLNATKLASLSKVQMQQDFHSDPYYQV